MELTCSNIKKFLIFSYISGNGTFQPKPKKQKKSTLKKNSYISENRTF